MTYREAYMNCKSLKELEEMLKRDIMVGAGINKDRLAIIKKEAEYVANLKFKED